MADERDVLAAPTTEAAKRLLDEYRDWVAVGGWEGEGWDPETSAANLARDLVAIEQEAVLAARGYVLAAGGAEAPPGWEDFEPKDRREAMALALLIAGVASIEAGDLERLDMRAADRVLDALDAIRIVDVAVSDVRVPGEQWDDPVLLARRAGYAQAVAARGAGAGEPEPVCSNCGEPLATHMECGEFG